MSAWIRVTVAATIQGIFATTALAQGAAQTGQGPNRVEASSTSLSVRPDTVLRAQPAGIIAVDGLLDEPAWAQAEPVRDLLQLEPDEGAPATQRSEIRVLFSATGVYVGAHLFDEDPARILETLGRRDDLNQADWFLVSLDSYFDRKTAYVFGVNAAGVQYDGIRSGGGSGGGGPGGGGGGGGGGPGGGGGGQGGGRDDAGDRSWDAIWESNVRIAPDGWTAEIHIPYSMLRFSRADSQTWGVHFSRRNPRLGEVAEWPFVPRTERANLLTRFGLLEGITGVEPRRNVQITPYTVSRLDVTEVEEEPGRSAKDASVDVGVDLKVGLGSAFTLNATVNPDFGQVESDPAELNLTAFETTFPEARPFFVEGSQIYDFRTGPASLVYTRRIGAKAPIIGAAKLSGRTAGGLSVGLLGATTGEDFDPNQHYGIARLRQEIGAFSSAGGILTVYDSVTAVGRRRSYSGGVDVDLRSPGNRYGLDGYAAFTHRQLIEEDDQSGFAWALQGSKRQGTLTVNALVDAFHHEYNPIDIGSLRSGDFYTIIVGGNYQLNDGRPFGAFQRARMGLNLLQQWTYEDRLDRGFRVRLNSSWTLRGFQTVFLNGGVTMAGYDPFQTRGLGPRLTPNVGEIGAAYSTDERRNWSIRPDVTVEFNDEGGRRLRAGMGGRWNVSSRLVLSGNLNGDWEHDMIDWSSNETFRLREQGWEIGTESDEPSDLEDDEFVRVQDQAGLDAILSRMSPYDQNGHYYVPVFGSRDSRALDATVRSSLTFTRNLDFSFYGQLFLARARYEDFQLLRDKDAQVPFAGYPKGNEFSRSRFQFNSVLRWEYRPGSTVFLVWSQGRNGDERPDPLQFTGPSPYDTPLSRQIGDTFDVFPQNVFMIKVNYAFLN